LYLLEILFGGPRTTVIALEEGSFAAIKRTHYKKVQNPTLNNCAMVAPSDGASSISVTVRVRPFTIREAAQLTKCDDGPLFLGDGSLAGVPTPKLSQKGIRPVIKVVDDKALWVDEKSRTMLGRKC